jgi:hypothetical protein
VIDRAWQRIRHQKQKKIKKEKKAALPRKLISKVPHRHKTLPLWSRKVKWKERETVYNTKFGNPVVYTSFPWSLRGKDLAPRDENTKRQKIKGVWKNKTETNWNGVTYERSNGRKKPFVKKKHRTTHQRNRKIGRKNSASH